MKISFQADSFSARKHARMVWQFFPHYRRARWLLWLLYAVMIVATLFFADLARSENAADWLAGWGLPESFSQCPFAPALFALVMLAIVVLGFRLILLLQRRVRRLNSAIVPPEEYEFDVSETEITMRTPSATLIVPLNKVTGLALNDKALAVGFTGTAMIIPRTAFASRDEEKAVLQSVAKGMNAGALQRSTETVRRVL